MLRYYEDLGFKKKRLSTFMSKKSVIPQARSPTMAMASGHSSKILFTSYLSNYSTRTACGRQERPLTRLNLESS